MIDFIRDGVVGDLRLGLSRKEVERRVGMPRQWLGKWPTFGPTVPTPEEADVWLYYDDAVGIGFDEHGQSTLISVNHSKIDRSKSPFESWPLESGAKMLDFRTYLLQHGIGFYEENDPGMPYYILADRRCVATSLAYEDGKLLPNLDQKIMMIQTVARSEDLPPFVIGSRRQRKLESPGGRGSC